MASAWTLRAQGRLDAAQRALETLLALSAPGDPGRLDLLARLAELAILQDDETVARRWLDAWGAAADSVGAPRDPARVLELEGRLARQRGRYDEAARMFEQVLRLRRDTGATGAPLAAALDGLADVERMNGRDEAAEILSREAVATVRATPDADATERTRYEGRWGQIRFDLGDEAAALAAFEAALAFAESTLGRHHPTLAIVHQYLANTHLARGAYADADQAYERAQAILDAFPDRGYLDERATLAHTTAPTCSLAWADWRVPASSTPSPCGCGTTSRVKVIPTKRGPSPKPRSAWAATIPTCRTCAPAWPACVSRGATRAPP